MANFLDLPLAIRQKVYRLHLVRDKPITAKKHKEIVNHVISGEQHRFMPPICLLSAKIEREAAPIYYGENEFDFEDLSRLDLLFFKNTTWPRHYRLIQKVTAYIDPEGGSILDNCRNLVKMKTLRELQLGVDERAMIDRTMRSRSGVQWQQRRNSSKLDKVGSQDQLSLLRFPGIRGLLALSGIEGFKFTQRQKTRKSKTRGTMPGGYLETQVLPKIRSCGSTNEAVEREEVFPFLSLHPEMRNAVYSLLLEFQGPLRPSKEKPTSTVALEASTRKKNRPEQPHSVLNVLAVNRQIHNEAMGIFYGNNAFVFYYPAQLGAFTMSLSLERQKYIKDLTVYYANTSQGGIDIVDLAFMPLRQLSGLKKLHVLMNGNLNRKLENSGWGWPRTGQNIRSANPVLMPGMKTLFQLRGLTDIKVRDLVLEEEMKKLKKDRTYPNFQNGSKDQLRVQLSAALDHLNKALEMAQLGRVNEKLLVDGAWHQQEKFPALE